MRTKPPRASSAWRANGRIHSLRGAAGGGTSERGTVRGGRTGCCCWSGIDGIGAILKLGVIVMGTLTLVVLRMLSVSHETSPW